MWYTKLIKGIVFICNTICHFEFKYVYESTLKLVFSKYNKGIYKK